MLRIATTQLPACEYGIKTIRRYLQKVDIQEVDVICFPEGYLNGYTRNEEEARERALDLSSDDFEEMMKRLGNFPEATQKLVDQGAEIVFYPLNNELKKETAEKWRHKHSENLIERAKQSGVLAVSSDVVVESDSATSYGCTAVIGRDGEVMAKEIELQEGTLIVAI